MPHLPEGRTHAALAPVPQRLVAPAQQLSRLPHIQNGIGIGHYLPRGAFPLPPCTRESSHASAGSITAAAAAVSGIASS